MKLLQHPQAQSPRLRDAQAITSWAASVQQAVPPDKRAARRRGRLAGGTCRVDGAGGCLSGRGDGAQRGVTGESRPQGGDEVGVEKARGGGIAAEMDEGSGGLHDRCSREEFEFRVGLVVASSRRRTRAVGEALACQKGGGIRPARNMYNPILELGEQVEPSRLMVAHVALLLEPLQTRIVRVQLEGFVEEIRPKRLQRVHDCKQLQKMGRV